MKISQLKWRSRKGIRELDIVLNRYIDEIFDKTMVNEQKLFAELLTLDGYELLDILYNKKNFDKKYINIVSKLTSFDYTESCLKKSG